ncbi:ABC transporter substrate-binding protein [Pseudogulbenkiania sp. MAI-1]|uniref:ABC transporter substrate-binding protein n=1 Tax=Pseudogulbenkiania sp. MAI-1 TaxID=990370 RepID=UPI00045E6CF7|nr:ABC transporter substrate-binding protein [Pseudogulbenkiania sp. MAI-1]
MLALPVRLALCIAAALLALPAAALTTIRLAYLEEARIATNPLANIEPVPADLGRAGAELAIGDNNTTGKFLQQRFELSRIAVPTGASAADMLAKVQKSGAGFVVLNVSAGAIDRLMTRPEAQRYLWFNAGAPDDRLRQSQCRANLLHTLPSRAMQADALAQYLATRRWNKWFLVSGPRPEDKLYAAAVRRAAKRFGGRIVSEKAWNYGHDARRTAQGEVPVFTQVGDYDVLIVADESGDFGDYLSYRTWLPRPVAGTQGLTASGWHAAAEQWGAVQLQNRFRQQSQRPMQAVDYAAWAAVRSVGEAASRTGSGEAAKLSEYIRGPNFELAGFKGRTLSYRAWNGELRQPMMVAQPRSLVSLSPQDGFLHPRTELDSLGFDAPEVKCK